MFAAIITATAAAILMYLIVTMNKGNNFVIAITQVGKTYAQIVRALQGN